MQVNKTAAAENIRYLNAFALSLTSHWSKIPKQYTISMLSTGEDLHPRGAFPSSQYNHLKPPAPPQAGHKLSGCAG